MAELHEQLITKKKEMLEQERLEREFKSLEADRKDLIERERRFMNRLQEEKEDVEALEKMSLTNLFYTVSGRKDEKLEEEKQEVIEAQLKWKEVKQSVQEIEEDMQQIKERIQSYGDPARKYEELWGERKQFLMEKGDRKGREILEIADKLSQIEAELEEIEEAQSAGQAALSALRDAEDSLGSASTWGGLDMLGGGVITTAVKHSKMDDANDAVHRSQRHLRKFATELEDIGQHVSATIEVSDALTVADYFFDGLIVDWFVQNKIHNSQDEVQKSKRNTQDALRKLGELAAEFQQEKRVCEGRLNHLVETEE